MIRRHPATPCILSKVGRSIAAVAVAAAVLAAGPRLHQVMSKALEQPTDQPWCQAANHLQEPLPGAPMTSRFDATPVPLTGSVATSGIEVTEREAILDFPTPPAARPDPDSAIVLLTYRVNVGRPQGWSPGRSIALIAFEQPDPKTLKSGALCPIDTPAIRAAMRAAGHTPLPDPIPAGSTVTGSVAIAVPRHGTDALTLSEQLPYPDDVGFAGGQISLYRNATKPPWSS
jgi:hypothetical protein